MADRIGCPHCGRMLELPESVAGREVRCPECQKDFTAPAPTSITAQAPIAAAAHVQPGLPTYLEPSAGGADDYDIQTPSITSRPYKSARGIALATKVMLVLTMLADLMVLGSSYLQYRMVERVMAHEFVPDADVQANDARQSAAGGLHLLVFVVTAIVFIVWFQRAYANLESFGTGSLTFTRGWAVGCWFVPILNLYRPMQIAKEIWIKSDPSGMVRSEGNDDKSSLVHFWWGGWIVSNLVTNLAVRMSWSAKTPGDLHSATGLQMISDGLSIVAAVLALLVVHQIDTRQTARAVAMRLE